MGIELTSAAAEQVTRYLHERAVEGLRLSVKPTGCAGYEYVIGYAESINPDDQVFESKGIPVIIDAKSLPLLEGTRVDFVTSGISKVFKFINPNATSECGCGESFTI
ncbi:MAG: iron-sulfur cluster assembly accessory protein [Gammaproteobacteria bacterium]|nr:iron-sulfur cluster assembly accessory protein [Gammaproteobacteria bacterium]